MGHSTATPSRSSNAVQERAAIVTSASIPVLDRKKGAVSFGGPTALYMVRGI